MYFSSVKLSVIKVKIKKWDFKIFFVVEAKGNFFVFASHEKRLKNCYII